MTRPASLLAAATLLFAAAPSTPAAAQGNANVTSVSATVGSAAPSGIDSAAAAAMARGHLRARGDDRGGTVPGPLFRLGSIQVTGHPGGEDMGLAAFAGQVADSAALESLARRVREYLLDHGHPFAAIAVDYSARGQAPVLDVRIDIVAGTGFKYGGFKPSGSRIRTGALERLSLLRYGEDYSESRLKRAAEKLARTGYFESIAAGTVFRDSVKNLLYPSLALSDLKGNRLGGLLGYDSEAKGRGGLDGYLDVHLINLRGTARDLDFSFEGKSSGAAGTPEREVRLAYVEPWIFSSPVGARIQLHLSQQDSVYDEGNREIALFQDLDFRSRYEVFFAWQGNRDYLTNIGSSASMAGLGLAYDARDRVPGTLEGIKVSVRVNGLRREQGDSSYYLAQTRNEASLWAHRGRWVAYAQFSAGGNWPLRERANRGELHSLGGANTIRGFREKEFLTDLYGYANLELQFLLALRSRASAFVVPAWINRLGGGVRGSREVGYGVGMEFGSRDWTFGVSYALNPARAWGDGFLHVKAANNF